MKKVVQGGEEDGVAPVSTISPAPSPPERLPGTVGRCRFHRGLILLCSVWGALKNQGTVAFSFEIHKRGV